MDRESDNFTAELLLKQLGTLVAEPGTTAAGRRLVRSTLADAGVPLAGVRIVDGSGLSLLDRAHGARARRRSCVPPGATPSCGRRSSPRSRSPA